jgi:hypothetical protein
MLVTDPSRRITLEQIATHPWVTENGTVPLVFERALPRPHAPLHLANIADERKRRTFFLVVVVTYAFPAAPAAMTEDMIDHEIVELMEKHFSYSRVLTLNSVIHNKYDFILYGSRVDFLPNEPTSSSEFQLSVLSGTTTRLRRIFCYWSGSSRD